MIYYLNEIGARISQNTNIDLTSVTAKEVTLLKPNGASKVWTGDDVVVIYAPAGSYYVETDSGDFNQTGVYFVQAKFTIGTNERRGPIQDLTVKDYLTGSAVDVAYVASNLVYDGSTYTTINAAVAAASAAGGGVVFLKPGTYTLASTLTIPKYVSLVGAGAYATRISYTGTGLAVHVTSGGAGDEAHRHYGSVCNLTLYTTTGTHGIRLQDLAYVQIRGVRCYGFSIAGLHLYNTGSEAVLSVGIHDSEFDYNEVGVLATGTNDVCNHVTFVGSRIRGNRAYNVRIGVGFMNWSFLGCDLEGLLGKSTPAQYTETESALFAQYGKGLVLEGCYYEPDTYVAAPYALQLGTYDNDTNAAGVFVDGVAIHGCTFLGLTGQTAILIGNASASQPTGVRGLDISGNYFYGFSVGTNPIDVYDGVIGRNAYLDVTTRVATRGTDCARLTVLDDPVTLATGTSKTVDNVITELQALGLVKQS